MASAVQTENQTWETQFYTELQAEQHAKQMPAAQEAYVLYSRHKDIYSEQYSVEANVAQSHCNNVT